MVDTSQQVIPQQEESEPTKNSEMCIGRNSIVTLPNNVVCIRIIQSLNTPTLNRTEMVTNTTLMTTQGMTTHRNIHILIKYKIYMCTQVTDVLHFCRHKMKTAHFYTVYVYSYIYII